jgi:transcriptional regulator with XRE-family HTH domain
VKNLVLIRSRRGQSQRVLARKAGISYKALQLIESGADTKLSTLKKISKALGYEEACVDEQFQIFFDQPPNSLYDAALKIRHDGESSWKIHLFNFVDALRRLRGNQLIALAPPPMSARLDALFASTVEVLCAELKMDLPHWCAGVPALTDPWFVADVENLKAMALVGSPACFRQRQIFVLDNFLERV